MFQLWMNFVKTTFLTLKPLCSVSVVTKALQLICNIFWGAFLNLQLTTTLITLHNLLLHWNNPSMMSCQTYVMSLSSPCQQLSRLFCWAFLSRNFAFNTLSCLRFHDTLYLPDVFERFIFSCTSNRSTAKTESTDLISWAMSWKLLDSS